MNFEEKVKSARMALNLSQAQLAEKTGISSRSIISYEQGTKPKRTKNIKALADALHVSTAYLMNDDITDPLYNIESEVYLDKVSDSYGSKAKKDAEDLLEKATTLFAGGYFDEDAKEVLMHSLMQIYLESKKEANEKYGSRKKKSKKSY